MKALLARNEKVGLHRGYFLGYLCVSLIGLSWMRILLGFEWPFRSFPVFAGMLFAAFLYGFDAGRRGMQCGPAVKSWILARMMVVSALGAALGLLAFLFVFEDLRIPDFDMGSLFRAIIKIVASSLVMIIICRFSFVVGVQTGYSAYQRRRERGQ